MSDDYIILSVVGVLSIGGALLLLRQAKAWRTRRHGMNQHSPHNHAQ